MREYEPAPDLAELPRLVESVRGAGLTSTCSVEGDDGDVPPGVSTSPRTGSCRRR